MAGVYDDHEIIDGADTDTTRLVFDFADNNGNELRIQYMYRNDYWATGLFEVWRIDGKSAHTHYRVVSHLLHATCDCFSLVAESKYFFNPDEERARCVLELVGNAIGSDCSECSEGLWRVPPELADIDLFEGTLTDCHGNRYRITNGKAKAYVNGQPPILSEFEAPQQSEQKQLEAVDDDIPF